MLGGQVRTFAQNVPVYVKQMSANSGLPRNLDHRFPLQEKFEQPIDGDSSLNSGLLHVGGSC
jgi:hypothetical protein